MVSGYLPDQEQFSQFLFSSSIPQSLQDFISKGTAFEPSARFQTCDEFLQALNFVPQNSAVKSTAQNSIGQACRTLEQKKKAGLIGGGAAVAVLLIVLMVFAFQTAANPADSAPQQVISSSSLTENSSSSFSHNTDADSSSETPSSLESMLAITDSGWTADEYGVVHFGITLQNIDSQYGVEVPEISIVGKSEDGTILFSEEQPLMYIQPGETVCYGSTAGDGSAIPATVEFKAFAPSEYNLVLDDASDNASFRIDNAHARTAHGGMTFTGEVALDGGTYPEQGMFGVLVTVILRDEAGNIVYGNSIDAGKPSQSSSVPFEISCFDAPDYATYELYAQVW